VFPVQKWINSFIPARINDGVAEYSIAVKKDGKFYVGYCLEIPQARGQGNTRAEAIKDTKRAIRLARAYLEDKKKNSTGLVTVSV
jgi:predicted RNase H-like HicB family nuclease